MTALSFGAGVNSTAILCLHAQGKYDLDAVIFADTHAEHPETYQHLETTVKPFCEEIKIPFHTVSKGDLHNYYYQRNIIPVRFMRHCTDNFKIRPIKKLMKKLHLSVTTLGIDYGERHRADRVIKRNDDRTVDFPLIDLCLDRKACQNIIKEFGWNVPIKSGCYFCPFQRKDRWLALLKDHRDLFLKAEAFEKNCKRYPKITLTSKPLEQIRLAVDNQRSLCSWIENGGEGCVFCHT